jgi:predicted LPLAT superfamily acyltransferase
VLLSSGPFSLAASILSRPLTLMAALDQHFIYSSYSLTSFTLSLTLSCSYINKSLVITNVVLQLILTSVPLSLLN